MEAVLEGWKSGAAAVQSVFRRCEYDWTIVSILDSSYIVMWGHVGLLVSLLDSGSSSTGLSPRWAMSRCVVFLVKTLHSHSDFLHPGAQMGSGKLNLTLG